MRHPTTRLGVLLGVLLTLVLTTVNPVSADGHDDESDRRPTARFATFNVSLNRFAEGQLIADLSAPYDSAAPTAGRLQAANVAEVIQRTRPDVLLLNEFDHDDAGLGIDLFRQNYLEIGHNGADPIHYPYVYVAESNTGIASGVDLDNNGSIGGPNDAYGFGFFPGQFGMAVLSRYPIEYGDVRTFQKFLWKDMPGNLLPSDYYSDAATDIFRLSSKSHWDVPIELPNGRVHFLVSHPTPPVFDGPEDRNGRRNHDEIRFWADYVHPGRDGYIYDDDGEWGGLEADERFVIAGDQNADPFDGDSTDGAIDQLLHHPKIEDPAPTAPGGAEAAAQGGNNDAHVGDPAQDTADFGDFGPFGPGNLRVDYVLPSKRLKVVDSGIFWPASDDPLSRLTGTFTPGVGFPTSDHRMVWVDIRR